jgi:hypothetical protein
VREPELDPAAKLRAALELSDFGLRLMRQNLRRSHPEETEHEIERRLARWLETRPGAESGDAIGRVVERIRATE